MCKCRYAPYIKDIGYYDIFDLFCGQSVQCVVYISVMALLMSFLEAPLVMMIVNKSFPPIMIRNRSSWLISG